MPIIGDGQLRAFAEGANGQRQYSTTVSMERPLRVVPSLDQRATQGEHGSISAGDKTLGFAAARADERGTDRRLRELCLASIFRDDLPPKPVYS